jgi:hypothetical protein
LNGLGFWLQASGWLLGPRQDRVGRRVLSAAFELRRFPLSSATWSKGLACFAPRRAIRLPSNHGLDSAPRILNLRLDKLCLGRKRPGVLFFGCENGPDPSILSGMTARRSFGVCFIASHPSAKNAEEWGTPLFWSDLDFAENGRATLAVSD